MNRHTIPHYQQRNAVYIPTSKLHISSNDQAKSIIAALEKWTKE